MSTFLISYTASRWTGGNFLFPIALAIYTDRVVVRRKRPMGLEERAIPIGKVASITFASGLLFADIRIESSGGSEDILARGFRKEVAVELRDRVQSLIYDSAAPKVRSDIASTAGVSEASKKCPFCAEKILLEAKKCRYCGEFLGATNP